MSNLKFFMHEDDSRKNDADFLYNHGSFSTIHININKCLAELGLLAKDENEADVVGFSSGTKLDFGFSNKKRFLINVFETNVLPEFLINERRRLELAGNYTCFGLSKQISDVWAAHGFPTDTIDIGVDAEFWKPAKEKKLKDKFIILSVTACNFRSGIDTLLLAFEKAYKKDNSLKLIIKNTDERNKILPQKIQDLRFKGVDVSYICERYSDFEVKDLYENSNLLVYIPINTSAGIPILEAAAMQLPCIVPDYCPTNLYPHSLAVVTTDHSITNCKHRLCGDYGLPYTFPPGVNEDKAIMHLIDPAALCDKILNIRDNYYYYVAQSLLNRKIAEDNWNWMLHTKKLVELIEKKYN